MVLVEVYVGDSDTPQYKEKLNCSDGYANVTLTGTGSQKIRVYFDGAIAQDLTQYKNFE